MTLVERGLHLVDTQTHQEAQGHQHLRETQLEVAKQAVGLLDWLLATTPDTNHRLCGFWDEAIRVAEAGRRELG